MTTTVIAVRAAMIEAPLRVAIVTAVRHGPSKVGHVEISRGARETACGEIDHRETATNQYRVPEDRAAGPVFRF